MQRLGSYHLLVIELHLEVHLLYSQGVIISWPDIAKNCTTICWWILFRGALSETVIGTSNSIKGGIIRQRLLIVSWCSLLFGRMENRLLQIHGALWISPYVTSFVTESKSGLSWNLLILFHTLFLKVFDHVLHIIVVKYVFYGSR